MSVGGLRGEGVGQLTKRQVINEVRMRENIREEKDDVIGDSHLEDFKDLWGQETNRRVLADVSAV